MIIRHRVAATLAALTTLLASAAFGASPRPAIVELYTSEGCSSCPPAEALVERLSKQPGVLPLAFHVDYWDQLGWHDRFSMKEATQRQQDLAHALGLATIGTPQLVVDGRHAVWGVDTDNLTRVLKTPRSDVPLSLERSGQNLIVRTPARDGRDVYDIYVVGYLPQAVTRIGRGENAGRTLTEVNVVRYIRKIGQSSSSAGEWKFPLASLPSDASHVVVFLQKPGNGAIVGAQTG
ncbi:MAG: DUF1223 domain-containing protein [Gammaproteobacteria bacterium]